MVRRVDAGFLAGLVADDRLRDDEAAEVADDLAHGLARRAFGVDR
jgi:glucuronate isomerase